MIGRALRVGFLIRLHAVEMPAKACANGMECCIDLKRGVVIVAELNAAQIGIAIFDTGTEFIGEGIFKAAAQGPAPFGVALALIAKAKIPIEISRNLHPADGEATRRIDQCPIESKTGAQT